MKIVEKKISNDYLFLLVFAKQPATDQHHVVPRNDRSHAVNRNIRAQLSSDIESSSVTDDSEADIITRNERNSLHTAAR